MPAYKPERREKLVRLHAQGLTDIEIARKMGVQGPWVCRLREQLGLPRNLTWHEADALPLYKEGMTDREIAAKLGVQRLTIFKWRQRQRLPAHPRRLIVPISHEERRKAYDETASDHEFARRLGITLSSAQQWRKRHGLPAKGSRPAGSGRKRIEASEPTMLEA